MVARRDGLKQRRDKKTLNPAVMAGPDPAIHANSTDVVFAWMLGSKAISDRRPTRDA